MATLHLHETTTSTPEQFVAGLTDFGPGRSQLFGRSADGYLDVHDQGPNQLVKDDGPRVPVPVPRRVRHRRRHLRRRRPGVRALMDASAPWPAIPYEPWRATRDTLHAHTQVLGKLAAALAPPEPQLQHASLRLSARGWETRALPAPDGSGAMVVALDLRVHEEVVEHSDGRVRHVPLTPDRPVGAITREVLAAVRDLVGPVEFNPAPQETPWTTPLDEDDEHATYDPESVATYFAAATRAALALAAVRAPYRGRASRVNAWWGTFDLAVHLFSGQSVEPASHDFIIRNSGNAQQVEVGWWPGDERYARAAFYAFAYPPPEGIETATLPPPARWDSTMGEYLLDWDDVRVAPDPYGVAIEFARTVIRHACAVGDWDPELADSAQGIPPPIT